MCKGLKFAVACLAIVLSSGTVPAQQRGQPQSQRPVAPVPAEDELFYRTFTATQLAQSDQPVQVNPTARRGPSAMPNTANVVEEIFKRGLGPIVIGNPGRMNAGGTPNASVILNSQRDVAALLQTANNGSTDPGGSAAGRRMAPRPSSGVIRLQKNLVALKVNMLICGNGITVNDPGDPFRDLSLVPDFNVGRFPIYGSCEECNAMCHEDLGVCFLTVELQCRCYLFNIDTHRDAGPMSTETGAFKYPRRLRDLAAFADNMLANRQIYSEGDFETMNETIEIVNGAFASDLPFGPQDIVQWGGPDGRLVLTSVRPLSEVPFLVNEP